MPKQSTPASTATQQAPSAIIRLDTCIDALMTIVPKLEGESRDATKAGDHELSAYLLRTARHAHDLVVAVKGDGECQYADYNKPFHNTTNPAQRARAGRT
jgi:hypothetical protein